MKMPILKLRDKDSLSEHFSLRELTRSMTAARCGIDNSTSDPYVIQNLKHLCSNILEPIRDEFGAFSPTSCYRGLALNRTLKSSDKSSHVRGEAADIQLNSVSTLALAEWCRDNLNFDQVILEYGETGWVHVSYQHNACRGLCLSINSEGTFPGLVV